MRTIRMKSGPEYTGSDALDIVEQMRQADFDPPPNVRAYIARAVARASHYFGVAMSTNPMRGTEAEAAAKFLEEAIEKGFAEEVITS